MRPRVCTRFIARTNHTERSKYSARCRAGTDVKGVLMRTFSPRLKSIGAILATAALLLGFTASAQASTEVDFVSNGGINTDGSTPSSDKIHAQGFVTGDETGYDVVSLILYIGTIPGSGTLDVTVRQNATQNNMNVPGTVLHTLTNPSNMGTGYQEFWFPANATLAPNTRYFVHITYPTTQGNARWNVTDDDDEDDDTYGSVIDNNRLRRVSAQNTWQTRSAAIKFKVKGHINDPPTSAHKTVSTNEDVDYEFGTVDFEFMDTNNDGTNLGETLDHLKITSLPEQSNGFAEGTLLLNGTDITISALPQTVTATQLGSSNFKYIPSPNLNGFTTFGFNVNDGWDDSASGYTIIVEVNAVNDAPTSADNKVSTSEDVAYTFQTGDFDYSDIEGSPFTRLKITSLPRSNDGTLSLAGTDISSTPQTVTATQLGSGDLKYTPPANSNGPAFATFNFKVNDGTADSAPAYTMTIDVVPEVSGLPTLNYAENGTDAIGTYTANGSPAWSLSGTDNDKFSISATGVLSFDGTVFPNGPDAENPVDVGTNNVYDVTVQATVSAGSVSVTGTLEVTVTVTNVDDISVFGGDLTGAVTEGSSNDTVDISGTLTISDEDSADPTIIAQTDTDGTYGSFSMTSGGAWAYTFDNADPDTNALDVGDTVDDTFTVTASDNNTQDVEITISGFDDAPTIIGPTELMYAENDTTEVATYSATDPEDTIGNWILLSTGVNDNSLFEIETILNGNGELRFKTEPNYEVSTDNDGNGVYRAIVAVLPPVGSLRIGHEFVNITVTDKTDALVFDGFSTTRNIDENSATETNVGSPVIATDEDTIAAYRSLAYSLASGTDASFFAIDESTGQITVATGTILDYETKESYPVTVQVTDGKDADGGDVTINLNDIHALLSVNPTSVAEDEGATPATGTFTLTPTDDSVDETNETLTVSDSNTMDMFMITSATLSLTDDDATPSGITLSVDPTSVAEEDDATDVTVTAMVNGTTTYAAEQTVTVAVGAEDDAAKEEDDAAKEETDYTLVADITITIPAGEASATGTFSLDPTGDVIDERDGESLSVEGSAASGVTVTGTMVTITDNEATPSGITLSVDPTSVAEEADATDVTVTVETDTQPGLAAIADQFYTRGVEIAALTLPSSSTGNSPLTYSLSPTLPAGLSFDAATRTLSGTPTGLQASTSYTYKVVDANANANEATQSFNITVLAPLPSAPVNLQATAGDARVTLTWDTANDDTISSWEYQQKEGMGGTYGAWTSITNSDAGTTAHALENLANDTEYFFRLRALNATGDGAASGGQSATPTAGNNPPTVQNPIADLTLSTGAMQDVEVSETFNDHDDDALTYTASSDDTSVATVSLSGTTLTVSGVAAGANTKSHVVTGLTNGTTYTFEIQARNAGGWSGSSNQVDATPPQRSPPGAATSLTATVGNAQVPLGWADPGDSSISAYRYRQSTDGGTTFEAFMTIMGSGANTTSHVVDQLTNGTAYTFIIQAQNAGGWSNSSNDAIATRVRPSGITLSVEPMSVPEEPNATDVTVTAKVIGNETYRDDQTVTVVVGAQNDEATEGTDYTQVNDITIIIPGGDVLATGTFSLNPTADVIDEGDGETLSVEGSAASGVTVTGTAVTITDNDAAPAAPVNFQATAGDARVTLTWDPANDNTITRWEYQQKQGSGGTYGAWTSITNSDEDTTAHALEKLTNGTAYFFQLRAVNATDNGASSEERSATPAAGNNPPTVQYPLADLTLVAGTTQDVDVSGTFDDHDDESLTYTASPADTSVATVSLSGTTLTVSGVAAGDTTVTVSASDNSASASDTFAVKVETDTQPVLAAIADQSYTRGVEIEALTLPSSSTGNGPLTYSLSPALPASLSFDAATRTLSGTPTGLQAATSYTYKVVDANADEATQSFNITVLAPLPAAPVNFQATAGDARVTLTWGTANDNTISSWEYQQKQGMGGTYGAWTSIANSDADTTAHARENLTNDTQYTFQLRAVNATGNGASSAGQSATPTAGNNPPTVQNRLADLTLIAGTTQDVDVSGTFDDHDDDTLTYTASPADTSVATVSLSGTTLTVSGVAAGDTTVTVSASDNSASASDTFAVKVETDTQPVLAAIADQSYTRGVEIAALTLPSSSTGNGPLTYSLSPALPAGLSFDAATRTLSGTPTGLQAATSYTYKVVDANADEATQSFNITVLAPLPAAPVNFQATAGDARVTLTWNTANDDTISSWEYQQKQGMGGTYGAWTSIANSDADTTAHARENLTNDTQYTFQLRAVNATGNGASSAGQSATPTAGNNPPTVQNRLADLTLVAGTTQDVDVSGTFDDHDDDTLTYTAISANTSVATVSLSETTLTVSGVVAGATTVTVSASDSSASASDTFAVTVETDTQPVLAAIADQSYTRGVEIEALTLPSSSTGNSPLTYSLSPALPAGLSFDAATRTLSGTPTGLQASTSYTYKVVDANADEATQSFNITVLAPLPAAPGNFQAIAGDARVTLTWDTANDDTISRWEYQQKQGTGDYGAWTSIASSDADTAAHALENLANDTQYTFQLRAVNATGNGASSGEQSATPTAGNNPPTVQNPIADLTLVAGTTQDVDVSGTFDDHDDDTLTYTAISANTSVATVSLSETTLTVSGVVAGATTVTVSASDSSASASDTFAVTVETDTQPVLAAIADQSYTRGVEIEALTLPSSSTGNSPLTYSLSPALPAGLSFDAATRTLSGTPTGLQAATSYTYKVVDANADEATQSFNITVLAPLPAAPGNFQAIAGDARVTLTWDTANDDTISRWEYQQKQGTGDYGAWTSIASSDADTAAHALENLTNDTQYTFQLRAVNATGNGASSGEQSATPTAGNNPPTVQNPIADLTLVAGTTQDVDVSGTFDDHDDDTLTYTAISANTSVATVSLSETTLTVSGVVAGATTVTVSASDSSASASDTFAVTVETDTQPVLAAIADQSYTRGVEIEALTLPSSSTGNSPLTYSLSPALPAGLSFDAATRTLSGTPTGLQASTSYTYKVVDANADEATQSFNITVLAPLPAAPGNFQAIAGDARVTLTWDTANDDTISRWEYQQKQGTGDYGAWTSIASSDADTAAHALENLTNDTQYTFQLRAVNATGNGASSGEQSATPTAGNNPPTVQNPIADLTLVAGTTQDVDVSGTFDDHDDDTLTYTAISANTSVATVSLSETTLTVSGVVAGATTVTVSASDSSASASDTFAVTVETDTQPVLAAIADQSYTRGVEIEALTLPSSSTGNSPLTYSLSPALPAGLSFDAATRTLSGTPTGLQASTSYTYKVVDANADEATQSFNITVLAPLPAAPGNFQAIAGDARVTLTWDTANDDTISRWEYQQKQGTGDYGAWTSIASSDADTAAHALENLTNDTQYTFQLRAVNATGNGASSGEQSATPTAGNNPPTVQNPIADLTLVAGTTQDVDVSGTFDDHDDDTLTYTAISANTSVATVSLSETTLTVSGVVAGATTVTVSASDSSASASDTFAVTVETDTQPVLAAIADQSYTRGVEIEALTLPSSSTGNSPLTYSLSPALPAGLSFDAATRTLSGTPTGLQASTSYTYKVVDANADEATQSFNITVLAPLPAAPGNFQAIAGDARVTLTWDTANDDTISRWEYQQKQGTGDYGAWTSIASSDADTAAHALENLTNDTQYTFQLRAVNATGNGASSGEQSATPTAGNNPPTVQNPIADLTLVAGTTQDVDVSGTFDDHDDDTLTYTAISANTSVATVSLSETTLTVSGVVAGATTVTVSASDSSASASDTFAVTVETDTQPVLAAIADQSYTRGVEIEALTLPSSSTGNSPLTYSLSPALPAGLSFDAATRTLSGTPTGLQASTSYTYKVVDANADEATQSFNITVLAPLPAAPGNFQAIAGDARVTLTWDTANDDTISRWEYQQKQGTGDYGAWTSIASSDADTAAHALENLTNDTQYTFQLRAVNATGNGASSGEQSATPTAGNNPPTVQNPIADLTLVAGTTQDVDVSGTFDDHDDDTLTYTAISANTSVATVSLSETTLTVSGVVAGATTVTVSASDSSASASDTFAVTVETDTQPVLAAIADQSYTRGVEIEALTLPSSSTGNSPLTYSLSPALPAGLSFDAATRTLSGTPTGLQASTSYTYKVVDANADEATQSFNITVLAPLPAAPGNFQAIAGDARVTLTWDTANDDTISRWEYQQKQGTGDYGAWTSIASSDADTAAHALENLTNDTQYTFQLRAVNATGNGASSGEQSATPTAGNNPPTVQNPIADLTLVAGTTQDVDVSGTFDDHDDDTLTYTAISANTSVATVSLSETTLTVSGVVAGATTVTVSASDSSASASDTFAVTVETDTQPVLAAIADQSYTRGVEIEALTLPSSSTGNSPLTYSLSPALPAGLSFDAATRTLSGTPTGLQASTSYTYKVVDANADEATQSFNITVLAPLPAAPVNFQAIAGDARVTLTWDTANDDTISRWEYQQKQGTGDYGAWTSIASSDADTAAHALENLTNDTQYTFQLRAVNATGNGASSGEQSATPTAGNNPPTVQNPIADLTLVAGTTQDVDVSGTFDDHDDDTLTYTAISANTSVATVSLSETTLTVSGVVAGATTVTVSASDSSASASDTFAVTVETDTQPVLAAIADQSYTRGVEIEALTLPSSSTGNSPLTYSLSPALPAGLSFDAATRTLSGTPTGLQASTSYTYKVVDANADEATQSFNITVLTPLPAAPVDFQAIAGDARVTLTWDPANDDTISRWEYQQKQGTGDYGAWTSIASSDADTTAHALENLTNDTQYTFRLRAVNATGNGASSGELSATPTAGNNPPTVQNRLADLTLVAGATLVVDVSGTFDDHDGLNDTLTYGASSDNEFVATVSLSGTTLTVSSVAAGATTVTVSATDNASASASDTFAVTVETNTQPGLAAIADQSYTRGVEIAALTLPSSSTGNGPLNYSLSPALPAGLSFDAATRTLSGTPTGLQAATSYTYKVVDANADEATQSFNITVLTPLPAAPVDFQAIAGDARVTLTWDPANDDTISRWEYQQKQGMGDYGAWTSIASSDADTTAHALENLTNDTQYTFRLRAVNATGNGASSGELSATPTAGNNPPTVQNRLADLTLVAGATLVVDVSGTFDDHDGLNDTLTYGASSDNEFVATVSLSGTTLTVSSVAAGATTVTVSATDNASASASDTFAVTVETNTQPGLAAIADQSYTRGVEIAALTLPSSSTGNGPLNYSLSPELPADLSFDAATRTLSGTPTELQASTSYTYKVVDADEDMATQSFNITVRERLFQPEQFSQKILEGMLAVTARSMGESAQTAIEGRFEQYRQWSQEATGESVLTSQPWRENSPTTLSPGESERIVGEGAGGRGAEGSLVQSHWGAANSSTAMGAGCKSENRETGTPGSRLRSLSLGSLGDVAHSDRTHSGASPGSGMEPSGSVYGQDRQYGSGVDDAPLGPGSTDMSGMRVEELRLSEISFEMSLGDSEKETSWVPVLWGQGDMQHFKGNLARFGMDYQGDLEAAHVGLDLYANNQMLAGLSFMRSLGDMEYTDDGIDRVLESRMHTVHPYLYWQPTERLSVWGIGGLGTGQVEVREPGQTHDFDTNFRMFAAGVRAVLVRRGNNEWGLRADAFSAQLETDALEGIAKINGEAHRGRLMLEWVHNTSLSAGRSMSMQMEAGGRFDGGDADRGSGAETGVRLGYLNANSGLYVALHGRLLVVHESDYQDWGVGVHASWDPGEKQRGLRASVMSSWGQDGGGQITLWDNADAVMHPAGMGALGTSSQYRMEIDVAYGDGMKSLGLPGLLTPYSRLRWTGQGRELSLGTEWSLPARSRQSLPSTLELEITRQENKTGPANLAVLARMSISFF